jgi:FkbM family methyltransferase
LKQSLANEAIDWLKGSRYGLSYRDKIILFLYILNAIIILTIIDVIFGKERILQIYSTHAYLLNWIPIDSITIKRDHIRLLLPLILDYIILAKPDWEQKQREFATSLKLNNDENRNEVLIDVGANIGIYTLIFASRYPGAKIISIEASQTIFEKLKINYELNKLLSSDRSKVVLFNRAVSDTDDEWVEYYENHSMSTISKEYLNGLRAPRSNACCDQINRNMVKTMTIDTLVASQNLDKISLLKIDVEGAEVLVLEGAKATLTHKKIKNLIIEYHSVTNYNCIIKLLEQLGYEIISYQDRQLIRNTSKYINGHILATLK